MNDASRLRVPKIDIIVPTRNRPNDLRRLLPTVVAQSESDFRLVVVDQSDEPAENAAAIGALADQRIEHIVQRETGKSKALNMALRRTSAPVIAFTDDDCTLPEEWTAEALASLGRNASAGLVFGSVLPAEHDPETTFIPNIRIDEFRLLRGPVQRPLGLVGLGANMIARRSLWEKIGLFDEDLGPGGPLKVGEEIELTYRVLQNGFDVVLDPALSVLHFGARPYDGGVALQLITSGFLAVAAGYGKHVRAGDLRAAALVGHEAGWIVQAIAEAAIKGKRPLHIRRLGHFLGAVGRGFRLGMRVPRV